MFKFFFDINNINILFYNFLKKKLPFSSSASSRIFATFCSLFNIPIVRMNKSKPTDTSFAVIIVLRDLTNEVNISSTDLQHIS